MDSSTSNEDGNKIEAENMIVLVKCDKENPELSDIYINKNNVNKDKPYVTHIGDFIQFSVSHKFKFYVKEFIENGPAKKKQRIDESVFNEEIKRQKAFAEEQELKRKELEEQLVNRQKEQEDLKARLDEIMKTKQEAEGKSEEQNELIKQLEDKIKAGNEVETQLQQNYTQLLSTVEAQKQQFEQLLNAERAKWQQTLDMTKQEKEAMEKKMLGDMAAWRLRQNAEWTTVVDELVKKEKDIQQKLVYCISMWMKKKRECPICRAEITTISRSLALDNFIEQTVNELSTHHKERRRELVNQHKAACRAMGIGVIKHKKRVVHKR
ncbi:hypothetical protein G9C98_005504 [Cotesia typhae]|uniref:Uncharacterized protein n=1 Tax=Cotesia typhae TaxID=2053667 RepID=A0A8J5V7V9_9HYME|nr:hypothetical protein G9C98_005504 [Cotesia typhae]